MEGAGGKAAIWENERECYNSSQQGEMKPELAEFAHRNRVGVADAAARRVVRWRSFLMEDIEEVVGYLRNGFWSVRSCRWSC
jgi:hypothetical protein